MPSSEYQVLLDMGSCLLKVWRNAELKNDTYSVDSNLAHNHRIFMAINMFRMFNLCDPILFTLYLYIHMLHVCV